MTRTVRKMIDNLQKTLPQSFMIRALGTMSTRGCFVIVSPQIGWKNRFLSTKNLHEKGLLDVIDLPIDPNHFKSRVATSIQFDWSETDAVYKIEAKLLIGVDPKDLHLLIQDHHIIFETKSDSKDDKSFLTSKDTLISVNQRSSLYLRQTIEIPNNVDEEAIVAKILADTVTITLPKRKSDAVRKDIKLE
jgi:HSP20 family molecular chaperone IbpA